MNAPTLELDDTQWQAAQEAAAQLYMHCSAEQFVARFTAGTYDGPDAPEGLMATLGFFPELD